MAITCPQCGADLDVTLFEFGRRVRCDCGAEIEYPGKDLRSGHVAAHPPMPSLGRAADEDALGPESNEPDRD
jgi:hypothetical protein